MARSQFQPLLIALALLTACDPRQDSGAQSSVTVDLPPARAATPRPGFSLDQPSKAAQPGDERSSQAVHELAASLR
jgi:hypothetical protein